MTAKKSELFKFPKGFKSHDGAAMPVDPETHIEPLIRTAEGFGSGGIIKAKYHDWTIPADEVGAVVGYRLVADDPEPRFNIYERF